MEKEQIILKGEYIKLDQALKAAAAVPSGGEAKMFILNEEVKVNQQTETRRGRKLFRGDKIVIFDTEIEII